MIWKIDILFFKIHLNTIAQNEETQTESLKCEKNSRDLQNILL